MGLTFTVEDAPDLTIPEDFIVRATLTEIVSDVVPYIDKKTGENKTFEKLVWWFEVTSDNQYNGRKVKGETDARISNHPRNKFRQWAEVLLGRELPLGLTIDVDDLLGLQVDLTVKHEADRKDPAKKYERVDDLLPVGSDFDLNSAPPF